MKKILALPKMIDTFLRVPEVFRYHGYRFFFFSREAEEPIHVHFEAAENYAKFWINPIILAESH